MPVKLISLQADIITYKRPLVKGYFEIFLSILRFFTLSRCGKLCGNSVESKNTIQHIASADLGTTVYPPTGVENRVEN